MATQTVTPQPANTQPAEWDAQGKPVAPISNPTEWDASGKPVQPSPSETPATSNQGMLAGMTGIPSPSFSQDQKRDFGAGKEEGTIAGARDAATMAVGGPLGSKIASGVKAVTAARPIVQSVATGLSDSAGQPIMKQVTTMGPSIAREMLSNPTFQKVAIHVAREGLPGLAGATWLWKMMFGK